MPAAPTSPATRDPTTGRFLTPAPVVLEEVLLSAEDVPVLVEPLDEESLPSVGPELEAPRLPVDFGALFCGIAESDPGV